MVRFANRQVTGSYLDPGLWGVFGGGYPVFGEQLSLDERIALLQTVYFSQPWVPHPRFCEGWDLCIPQETEAKS